MRMLMEEWRAGWWADSRDIESIRQLFIDAAREAIRCRSRFNPTLQRLRNMSASRSPSDTQNSPLHTGGSAKDTPPQKHGRRACPGK